jgi:phospholipase/carboxylesterase
VRLSRRPNNKRVQAVSATVSLRSSTLFNSVLRDTISPMRPIMMLILFSFVCGLAACGNRAPEKVRVEAVFSTPQQSMTPGTRPLELGSKLFINTGFQWRDGLLHVPKGYDASEPPRQAPLLVWLHGGGGDASDAENLFPIADEFGVVVLSLDSRHNTWDAIDSPYGPDLYFMEKALQHVAGLVAIDPKHVALGGLSDGASYALAVGRANGDLFTHLVGISPWSLTPPGPAVGQPRVLIGHGTRDTVYPEWHSRRVLVPGLADAGYDVTYFTFDGPHWATDAAGRAIMRWLQGEALGDEVDQVRPPL